MVLPTLIKKGGLLLFIVLLFTAASGCLIQAHAQTSSEPTFYVTWGTTGSYVPSFYQGKGLPTYSSKITASFELISPDGKVLNVSGQSIYWYLNDNLIGGGVGVQQVTFSPLGAPPNTMNLRITIPDYNGAYLIHSISIPMVLPKAVIYAPYPNGQFSQNPLTVEALPYFFNVSDPTTLSYAWSVNGQSGSNTENPETAEVTLPQGTLSGTGVDVTLSMGNPNDSTVATAGENLIYENQL